MHLARRHDRREDLVFDRVRGRVLGNAARIKGDIETKTGHRVWVQAVVVIWSEFPQGLVDDGQCVFIHGPRLRDWIADRPVRLGESAIEEIAGFIESDAAFEPSAESPRSTGGLIPA